MLPVPFKQKGLPPLLRDNISVAGEALCAKIDSNLLQWSLDTKRVQWLFNPEQCPSGLLPELGYKFAVQFSATDTDQQKRVKIRDAIQLVRQYGLFDDDIKARLDAITGFSSSLFKYNDTNKPNIWQLCADTTVSQTSVFGDGNPQIGILLSSGQDQTNKGSLLIDLGSAGLSAPVIQQCVDLFNEYFLPAYFRLYLGYAGGIAGFTAYPNGVI